MMHTHNKTNSTYYMLLKEKIIKTVELVRQVKEPLFYCVEQMDRTAFEKLFRKLK